MALLAFPQGMAYAAIAGLPIRYGIFGSAVAAILAPLFSGSRFIVLGPTNATAVMIMSSFLALGLGGNPEQKLAMLPLLLFLVGVFLVFGAFLKVANLIQYISRSVVTGYISGAALLIITNQVRKALGYTIPETGTFFGTVIETGRHLPDTKYLTLTLSAMTALIYLVISRRFRKLPTVALTLVIMSVLTLGVKHLYLAEGGALADWQAQVTMLDAVSGSEWLVTVPVFKLEWLSQLASVALAIAFLSILEGSSIGKTLAARSGSRLDSNQEMFSMGMANLGCAFLSGMPASGSLTRSQLNYNSGAATPLSSLINGGLVAAAALLLGGYIRFIPVPVLAVLVICIGVSLFHRDQIRIVTKATKSDATVFFVTLVSALLFKLDTAIYFGVATSILLFLRKAAMPELVEYAFTDEGQLTQLEPDKERAMPEISIVHVEGDLFFGAAELFRDQMRRICADPNLKVVILKMRNARHLDASSVLALGELLRYMQENNRTLLVSEARTDAMKIFHASGMIKSIGEENILPDDPANPTLATAQALKRAVAILGTKDADISIYAKPKPAG